MTNHVRIVGVSDVSLGYGSPQIPSLLQSLRRHFAQSNAHVLEPDQSERPPKPELFPDLVVQRLYTQRPLYDASGILEYVSLAAKALNQAIPDILVLTSPFLLAVLQKLKRRPKFVIYYMLESLTYYNEHSAGFWRLALDLARAWGPKVDLIISPEENRAILDTQLCHLASVPVIVAYNAVNARDVEIKDNPERHRFLYSGTIQRGLTYAEYFLADRTQRFPIDLYGLIEGADKKAVRNAFFHAAHALRYCGYLDNVQLAEIRKDYAFSLVLWKPSSTHQLYACPNKFFEAIADGVPPIAAPHPQCKQLIERYDCGILMDDWSYAAFRAALKSATAILGTPRYAELLENCRSAVQSELNWEAQFAKIAHQLPAAVH